MLIRKRYPPAPEMMYLGIQATELHAVLEAFRKASRVTRKSAEGVWCAPLNPWRMGSSEDTYYIGVVLLVPRAESGRGTRIGAQPQRELNGLHPLPHDVHKFVIQCLQVGFVSKPGGEGFKRLCCVVLTAVEAPLYKDCVRRLKGLKRAAITRVEIMMAGWDSWPVRAREAYCKETTPPT